MDSILSILGANNVESDNNIKMVLPTNTKKYLGHIREYENRYVFEYKSSDINIKELFYFRDLGSKENAYQATLLFQKKWCQNHKFITNLYYIVENKYVLVRLNDPTLMMKVDIEDIPLIENHNWRIQNNSPYATTFKTIDNKRKFITFYKLKFDSDKVHFRNNDKLDYRNENIILIQNNTNDQNQI